MEKTNQVREMLPPEAQTLYDDIVEARVLGASKHIKLIFKMVEIVNNFYDQPSEVLDITIRLCEFFKEKRGKSSYAIVNALDDFLSNLPDVSSNEFRKILNEHVEHSINKMQLDVDKCVENALRLSEHNEFKRIMIYDYSSTVDKFLKELDPNVEVVIPESKSINGGVPFLKNAVLHKRCKFIFDCAIADELPQCDAVFIGAETFFINGDAFNTIGSDLVSIIAKEYKKPLNIIGAGSNLLVMDGLIKGTVISTKKLNNVYFDGELLVAEAGALNSKLYNVAKNNGIADFEFLACIPGTVGGACKMNAGCYGFEVKDILSKIKVINTDGNIIVIDVNDCGMSYRKNSLSDDIFYLEAYFKTNSKNTKENIEKKFIDMYTKKRSSQPITENTCGSTFKNISPDLSAWQVIKKIGLQGVDFNGVKFSEKNANFLINYNNDKSNNILNLINLAKTKAKEELGVDLELEIKIIGNSDE